MKVDSNSDISPSNSPVVLPHILFFANANAKKSRGIDCRQSFGGKNSFLMRVLGTVLDRLRGYWIRRKSLR